MTIEHSEIIVKKCGRRHKAVFQIWDTDVPKMGKVDTTIYGDTPEEAREKAERFIAEPEYKADAL